MESTCWTCQHHPVSRLPTYECLIMLPELSFWIVDRLTGRCCNGRLTAWNGADQGRVHKFPHWRAHFVDNQTFLDTCCPTLFQTFPTTTLRKAERAVLLGVELGQLKASRIRGPGLIVGNPLAKKRRAGRGRIKGGDSKRSGMSSSCVGRLQQEKIASLAQSAYSSSA